jgi:hypothetical protein
MVTIAAHYFERYVNGLSEDVSQCLDYKTPHARGQPFADELGWHTDDEVTIVITKAFRVL